MTDITNTPSTAALRAKRAASAKQARAFGQGIINLALMIWMIWDLRQRSLATVLREVNQMILRQFSASTFVSVFLAVVDPKKQTFRYANAGHNPPLVRRACGTIESLTRTGTVLGLFEDLHMSETTITLGAGDAVVLYTDGVTEAWHPQRNEEYGVDRLTAAITAAPHKAGELLAHVEADLNAFIEDTPQQDDVTFLVLTAD